jgi:hypothetical protein
VRRLQQVLRRSRAKKERRLSSSSSSPLLLLLLLLLLLHRRYSYIHFQPPPPLFPPLQWHMHLQVRIYHHPNEMMGHVMHIYKAHICPRTAPETLQPHILPRSCGLRRPGPCRSRFGGDPAGVTVGNDKLDHFSSHLRPNVHDRSHRTDPGWLWMDGGMKNGRMDEWMNERMNGAK